MTAFAILFFLVIGCWLWAMLKSDYKQFMEDEQDKDDEYNDPDSWGT